MRDDNRQVGPLERLHNLKSVPSFRELPQVELAALAQHAGEKFFRRRQVLLREGEPVESVHLVVEGRVRLVRNGKQLADVGPGEALGLLELLSGDPDGVLAIAETETLTLSFKREVLFDILEDHFSILHHLVKDVCALRLDQLASVPPPRTSVPEPSRRSSGLPPAHELDLAERIIFLRRAFPFARGRIAEVAELARHAVEEHHEPGTSVWQEGDESDHFLVVVRGTVACGRERGAVRLGSQAIPGLLEALAARPRASSAVVEEDEPLQALRLDVDHLLDVFEDNLELALEYLGAVARETVRARQAASNPEDASSRGTSRAVPRQARA